MESLLAQPTFLRLRSDGWSALGTWLAGLVTVGLLLYAVKQLKQQRDLHSHQSDEARRILDLQTRAYIIVDFHFRSVLISLSARNIGTTPARRVRVSLDQKVESAVMPAVDWKNSGLFSEGVEMFAPGREMLFPLDVFPQRLQRGLPMRLTGNVEYELMTGRGSQPVSEPFALDLSSFKEALPPPKDLTDLVEELARLRRELPRRAVLSNYARDERQGGDDE